MKTDWNPRYVSYARFHRSSPEEMMKKDEASYPGGVMCGFILWMKNAKEDFKVAFPECFIGPNIGDQDAWDAFLEKRSGR